MKLGRPQVVSGLKTLGALLAFLGDIEEGSPQAPSKPCEWAPGFAKRFPAGQLGEAGRGGVRPARRGEAKQGGAGRLPHLRSEQLHLLGMKLGRPQIVSGPQNLGRTAGIPW
jgi:hypothetical protein